MSTELVETGTRSSMTARDLRLQVNLIQEIMKEVMKGPSKEHPSGIHYGIIPGCPKPSLFKPGAEKIAVTFRIAVKSEVQDLSYGEEKRYRVTCTAFALDGSVLGSSTGECSSDESKYRWRAPVCDQEFEECDSDRKREKWIKTQQGPKKIKQIKTEAADLANTILQMADKRAYVAVVRKVTAASDVFTQDIEDLPEEVQAEIVNQNAAPAGKPVVDMPKEKEPEKKAEEKPAAAAHKAANPISDPQSKRLYAIRKSVNYPDDKFKEWLMATYKTDDRNIERENYDAIVAHVQGYNND